MNNTLFGRTWNSFVPDYGTIDDKVVFNNEGCNMMVEGDIIRHFQKCTYETSLHVTDLPAILENTSIRGKVMYLGNFNNDDHGFMCFATEGLYYMRIERIMRGVLELRIGEVIGTAGTYEWSYRVFKNGRDLKLVVRIEESEKKTSVDGFLKAKYSYDNGLVTGHIFKYGEHVDYEVELSSYSILQDNNIRDGIEIFFLDTKEADPDREYIAFIRIFEAHGVIEEQLDSMQISVSIDAQKKGRVLYKKGRLFKVSFFEEDESFWQFERDRGWEYMRNNIMVTWTRPDDKGSYMLRTKVENNYDEVKKLESSIIGDVVNHGHELYAEFFPEK